VSASSEHRINRLRQLLAQLERLPASPERDRMLREVRARVVDVDTGDEPTTLLAGYAESALAADPRVQARQAPKAVPPAPPEPPKPGAAPHGAGVGQVTTGAADPLPLAPDEVLSLDDSDPFWPADAPADLTVAPWTRGLRG
jgi:hypothetical protein